ncbi:MAG: CoB--CoM heterodisulfide reductase iron-sulfur subunit B family protein [Pseudomonadota bacterium]
MSCGSYAYYPGCSAKATGAPYEQSLLAVAKVLDLDLQEIDDWNCCGATAYFSVREKLAMAISARNLALAEKMGKDIVAPCSACYLGLDKTNKYLWEHPETRQHILNALAEAGLTYNGETKVLHALEMFIGEDCLKNVKARVTRRLTGLKVAGYVGCQMVRPYGFDDPEYPESLDTLTAALGATPVKYPNAARCCGGSQIMTNEIVALRMTKNVLLTAVQAGADCIITTCPLCHMNLDMFQAKVNAEFGTSFAIPVLYFTQLMGLAMQVDGLGIEQNIVGPSAGLAAWL